MDIVIVTWNNLDYLKCLIKSIKQNSVREHNILVHINEDTDGTMPYLCSEMITHTHSVENLGLVEGANTAASLGEHKDMLLVDDDMYLMPNWDMALETFKTQYSIPEEFMLCLTMIEPNGTNTLCVAPVNYGHHPVRNFYEDKLIQEHKNLALYAGAIRQYTDLGPFNISRALWKRVGGYGKEFSPAIGSENDLAKKVWDTGYHDIVNVPTSLVYHFQCTSTGRLSDRAGHSARRDDAFEALHGMSVENFHTEQLRRGQTWNRA